jgi:lysozyme
MAVWDGERRVTLIEQLARDEGVRLKPYRDTVGKLTIGVGRNLDAEGISQAEAMILLANDIQRSAANLSAALPWTSALDDVRRGVLINMTFNLGIGGLLGFKRFLAAMESRDWLGAQMHMMESLWAVQVGDRAKRLATQLETGEWT